MLHTLQRALAQYRSQRRARREAEAQALCDRIIRDCRHPIVRLCLLNAAGGYVENPIRLAARLRDLRDGFAYAYGAAA